MRFFHYLYFSWWYWNVWITPIEKYYIKWCYLFTCFRLGKACKPVTRATPLNFWISSSLRRGCKTIYYWFITGSLASATIAVQLTYSQPFPASYITPGCMAWEYLPEGNNMHINLLWDEWPSRKHIEKSGVWLAESLCVNEFGVFNIGISN